MGGYEQRKGVFRRTDECVLLLEEIGCLRRKRV